MSAQPIVRIEKESASCTLAGKQAAQVDLKRLIEEIERRALRGPSCRIVPQTVRAWTEHNNCVALAIELLPGPRTVPWLAEDSEAPFGRRARYRDPVRLSFPYVVLPVVFIRGALTPLSQLYYRTRPLTDRDDALLLPNLPNVARGYGLKCWACLVGMRSDLAELAWADKVRAIGAHVFGAGFNRSSEMHEGNSYVDSAKSLDARLASVEAWAEATAAEPMFALQIPWASAETTLQAELEDMLAQIAPYEPIENAAQLAGLVTRTAARKAKS